MRVDLTGSLCGYVGVPQNHLYYALPKEAMGGLIAHWGINYAAGCRTCPPELRRDEFEAQSVCHIVDQGDDDDVWWLGFDCAHCYDRSPAMMAGLPEHVQSVLERHTEYRDMAYVTAQVTALAAQLGELA